MSNTNRMKPASEVKQQNLQRGKVNSGQTGDVLSGIKLEGSTKRPNKNLLEKYSFEDNDLSRSQNDITLQDKTHHQPPSDNDHDWLQLSVKQITLFSRELITFYLQIQYTIVYQSHSQNNLAIQRLADDRIGMKGNKYSVGDRSNNKFNDNLLQRDYDYKEVKSVRSKLVHGFIMQNQGKHLILSLKSKPPQLFANTNKPTQSLQTPSLTQLQFSLIRVYQTSKQGKILCQQTIPNPTINKEYQIDFMDDKMGQGQKQKPIGTMMFELFSAIIEEPLAKQIHEEEVGDSEDGQQIPEDISPNNNSARVGYENYTLGVPQNNPTNTKSPRNVFDNNSQDDQSQQEPNNLPLQKRPINNTQPQSTIQNALVFKLNQHSMRSDNDNLSDSRMDDAQQRQYNVENTLFIDQQSKANISMNKAKMKNAQGVGNNLSDMGNNETKQLKVKQKQQIIMSPNEYTYVEDGQESRYQGNTTDQRENYMSTLEYSKYVNQDIVLKAPQQINTTSINKQNNQLKKIDQNKVATVVESSKTPKFESVLKNAQQKHTKPSQSISKNAKRQFQPTPSSQKSRVNDESAFQDISQQMLPDMDSSNIRFKFDENDISNIQQTKNMQDLINEIQKIQKEWYQKRVLNRQLKENQQKSKSQYPKLAQNTLGKNTRSQSKQEDNVIDLQLGKFKIKFDQGTFYNKLIDNLKNKHLTFQPIPNAKQNKSSASDINGIKTQQNTKAPKDYTVSIIAHELDEQSMSNELSQKMQIKIPSKQIQDLIQSQKEASQLNPQLKSTNSKSQTQSIRNQIIKDFEKQLYSKVLKIKVDGGKNGNEGGNKPKDQKKLQSSLQKGDEDNDPQKHKTKAKIIEIALQQDSLKFDLSLSDQQNQNHADLKKKQKKNGRVSKLDENRISLIGMYPLHLPNTQNNAQETSFYHNLSTEPLSIQMYNIKTGNQQGKLSFQIKKGKKDKQMQTFESLHDFKSNDINRNENQSHPGKIIKQKPSSRLSNPNTQSLFRGSPAQEVLIIDPDHQTQKLDSIDIRLPNSQRVTTVNIFSPQGRLLQNTTQIGSMNQKVRKVNSRTKTEDKIRNFTKKSFRYDNNQEDTSPSYRLIKQELQQTAGLLENLKLRAQDFLNKVSKEKGSQNSLSKNQQLSPIKHNQNQRNAFISHTDEPNYSQGRNSVISEMILQKPTKKPYQNQTSINSNFQSYYSGESPNGTKKNSINNNITKQNPKKPFSLKQAGDYHFDHQQSLLPISLEPQQKTYSPIRGKSSLAQQQPAPISVELYSMKIKLLSVNNNHSPIKRQPQNTKPHNNPLDYFVLIHSQFDQHELVQGQLPYLQKCYKPSQGMNNTLYAEFPITKSRLINTDDDDDGALSISGKQQNKIFIELYHSSQAQILEQMNRNYGSRLNYNPNRFSLVTQVGKSKQLVKPIGVLPVNFIQLMAQSAFQVEKSGDNSRNKPNFLNYTNFLYNGDKITGKININYVINQQQTNPHPVQLQHSQPDEPLQRQNTTNFQNHFDHLTPQRKSQPYDDNTSNISTSKNTHQFKLKNTLIDRYNQNISMLSKDNSRTRNQRSQSGMTKKVSSKKKKINQNRIYSPQKQQQSRLVDPLEILKRRLPKPMRVQQKPKSHSHSYHVRINRPFQTPMNRRVGTHFDSLNSSQSMRLPRQKTTDFRIPLKTQMYSQINEEQKQQMHIAQTPQLSQPQFISPKLDKSSQIRKKKNTVHLKGYNIESRIYPTEQTRISHNRKYDGGNIKFGKSSRFNAYESPQMMSNSEKASFPGPGQYEVKSMFERHGIKQP